MPTGHSLSSSLAGHAIFSPAKSVPGTPAQLDWEPTLQLSTATLPSYLQPEGRQDDGAAPSGRRKIMVIRDSETIVAAGQEIRMTSLNEVKAGANTGESYTALLTPAISFDIHQLALNPSGKLLAVAGKRQVAVVVLPRTGFSRRGNTALDCKSVQIGQYYHGSVSSPPIAKVEWHPWGEAGSTLMVMTIDGKLREYDISADSEEPQQIISFVSERKKMSVMMDDPSEREVASFSLGKGKADWGPLTVYAVMRSGDIYAVCPYMPRNASIPSSYVHALDCFVAAKQEFLSQEATSSTAQPPHVSMMYDYQQKYVAALLRQLPPGTVFPAVSRSIAMHPPSTIKNAPAVQGPFLLQPAPRLLDGSDGGDATDIVHTSFSSSSSNDDTSDDTERLGVVLIAYQDGRVDVCLDVEKVEARWEVKQGKKPGLPMLTVYETIDLGLVSALTEASSNQSKPLLDLLQVNHLVLVPDPIHDNVVYVYHAFGVHALDMGDMINSLMTTLHRDDEDEVAACVKALETSPGTLVQPIVSTFSVERKCSNPVVAVAVPNDVYLTYSIFVLTSAMRVVSFPLTLQSGPSLSSSHIDRSHVSSGQSITDLPFQSSDDPPAYISLLGVEPFVPASILTKSAVGLPTTPRLVLPPAPNGGKDFQLTPETLRYLGTSVEKFRSHIQSVQLAHREAEVRAALQMREFTRQQDTCAQMIGHLETLKTKRIANTTQKLQVVRDGQTQLLGKMDRILKGLMQKASPSLSEHETKWFEELSRMKAEVIGAGRYDEESLSARTRVLQREFEKMRPGLEEMHKKDIEKKRRLGESDMTIGISQAQDLGTRSKNEQRRIQQLVDQVEKLALKVDIPLGQGPVSKSNIDV